MLGHAHLYWFLLRIDLIVCFYMNLIRASQLLWVFVELY